MENVTLLIKAIIYLIQDNNKYLKNLMPYFKTIDDLATHSIHVAIYAINLGHSLEFSNKKLLKLGIAGLLHDIGTIKIDTAILNKDSSLTQEEIELIQHHPKYSVELLTQNDISDPDILDTVLHHHENNDGTGYPDRLQGKSIRKCSAILSIVNVFNALTSDRAHRKAFRSFEALKIMMQDKKMRNKFNTDYIEHFLRTLQ
jgi:HD-GYP domain-containing protein (c-di-GMP phosphodiesterase class II)